MAEIPVSGPMGEGRSFDVVVPVVAVGVVAEVVDGVDWAAAVLSLIHI